MNLELLDAGVGESIMAVLLPLILTCAIKQTLSARRRSEDGSGCGCFSVTAIITE